MSTATEDKLTPVAGDEITAVVAAAMKSAVRAAVHNEVARIAADAVSTALTQEIIERLQDEALTAATAQIGDTLAAGGTYDTTYEGDVDVPPPLQFHNCEEFLTNYVTAIYWRRVGTTGNDLRWSRRWWRYPEAIARVDPLWRAFENLRHDPGTGMAVWWRDYFDPTMRELMSLNGPFGNAPKDELLTTETGEPWTLEPAPEGLFPRGPERSVG